MRRVHLLRSHWRREFQLGIYADWRDVRVQGVDLVLKLGFWSAGIRFATGQTLAERMIETLKQ